jgi:hypothetical protein
LSRHENNPPNSQGPVTVQIGVEQLNMDKFHGSGVEQLVEMVLPTEFSTVETNFMHFSWCETIFHTCGEIGLLRDPRQANGTLFSTIVFPTAGTECGVSG